MENLTVKDSNINNVVSSCILENFKKSEVRGLLSICKSINNFVQEIIINVKNETLEKFYMRLTMLRQLYLTLIDSRLRVKIIPNIIESLELSPDFKDTLKLTLRLLDIEEITNNGNYIDFDKLSEKCKLIKEFEEKSDYMVFLNEIRKGYHNQLYRVIPQESKTFFDDLSKLILENNSSEVVECFNSELDRVNTEILELSRLN